jgi:hypothetical protein
MEIKVDLQRNDRAAAQQLRADLKKLNTDILSDSDAAKKAEAQLAARMNKEIVASAMAKKTDELKAIEEVKRAREAAADEAKSGFEGMAESSLGVVKSLGGMALGMAGVGSASTAVSAVVEHFRDINREIFKSGQFIEDYKKALKELATMRGMGTTEALKEDLDFRAKTLQSADEATKYQEIAYGAMGAAIDKPGKPSLITPGEARKALEFGGAFQGMVGGDAPTHGRMIGILPSLLGRRTTGGELAQTETQLYDIMKEAQLKFPDMAKMYAEIAPEIMAKAYSPMRGAAILTAMSGTTGAQSAAEMKALVRGTIGSISKTGKPRVEGGEPIGKYLKELGIDNALLAKTQPTDLLELVANKISDDLKAQQKGADAKGEQFQPLVYLKHKGYMNQEDVNAMVHYATLQQSGLMGAALATAAPEKMPSAAEAQKRVADWQRTDTTSQAQKAAIAIAGSRATPEAEQSAYLLNLFGTAQARLRTEPGKAWLPDVTEDVMNMTRFNYKEWWYGERSAMEMEAQHMLIGEAQKVGVKADVPRYMNRIGEWQEDFMGQPELYELAQRIRKAGGQDIPGFDMPVRATAGGLAEQAEAQKQAAALDPDALGKVAAALNRNSNALEKNAPAVPKTTGAPTPNVTPRVVAR